MRRVFRFFLWALGIFILLIGGTVLWVESQLRPEPLGIRVKDALTQAHIGGSIARVEASLDGSFSAEGVDLTLEDGTQVKLASVKGAVKLLPSIKGTYTLESIDIKNIELDLSHRHAVKTTEPVKAAPATKPTLPPFALGPYSVTGRVTLADGTLLRFTVRGDQFASQGNADLRAGVAWPGFTVGTTATDPRGEVVLKANFRRPLGGAGLSIEELTRDIGSLELNLTAKDASPVAAGAMEFNLTGKPGKDDLFGFTGVLLDSGRHEAIKFQGSTHAGVFDLTEANLDIDPTRFGILSASLPDFHIAGSFTASANTHSSQWKTNLNLKVLWADLHRFSASVPAGTKSEWAIQAEAQSTAEGFSLDHLSIAGNGIQLTIPKALQWKGGVMPEESPDATVSIVAQDANLITLTPFSAIAKITPTEGTWTGAAELSFKDGQPIVNNVKTHSFKGLTIERDGKVLLKSIDAEVPLVSKDGTISIKGLSVSSPAGAIARGDVEFHPGKDGSWNAAADVDVGIAELAAQPGWEDLPIEKLKGIRVVAQTALSAAANQNPVVNSLTAKISRAGTDLLTLKLRQPYVVGGPKPTGVLVEASAANLPLESVAAVVPGLKVTGNLDRAEIVAGFKAEGLFVRTEGAPMAFVGTSVTWNNKTWVQTCDLNASLDLLIGEKSTVLGFQKAELKNKGRILAAGDISLGLGEASTTLKLSGNLAALGEQPFAAQLAIIGNGTYNAVVERNPAGDVDLGLDLKEVRLKNSTGQVKSASVRGKYHPLSNGLSAEGQLNVIVNNVTSGHFSVTQKFSGAKTDWKADITLDNIDADDLLTLAPQEKDVSKTPPPPAKKPVPDKAPVWENQSGNISLAINKANAKGIIAKKVVLQISIDEKAVHLDKFTGQLAEGTLSGRGQLGFNPKTINGPYTLATTVSLHQFEIGSLADAFPDLKKYAQGNADVSVSASSVSPTVSNLANTLQLDLDLLAKNGHVRAFGGNQGATEFTTTAGQVGEIAGGLAMIAGVLTKNQAGSTAMSKTGAALAAASKLQKAFADFAYDTAEVKASRLPTGTLKIDKADIRNKLLHFTINGGIGYRPNMDMLDWPMILKGQLRGSGEFANYFTILGFSSGKPEADGLSSGPTISVTGSMNNVKTDLNETIQAAINRATGTGTSSNLTNGNNASPDSTPKTAPTNRNPLGDLFKELGR